MAEITPSGMPSYMRRCVVELVQQGHDIGAAFAICNATMQRAGYITKGPNQRQTQKGRERQRHFSAKKDAAEFDAEYEKILKRSKTARAKKSSGQELVESPILLLLADALGVGIDTEVLDARVRAEGRREKILRDLAEDIASSDEFDLRLSPPESKTHRSTAKYLAKIILHAVETFAKPDKVIRDLKRTIKMCRSDIYG
jgi:hypothetical protein